MKNILLAIFAAAITFASCIDNAESNPEKEITQKKETTSKKETTPQIARVEKEAVGYNESGEESSKILKTEAYTYNKDGYINSITSNNYKTIFTYNSAKQLTEKVIYKYDSEKKEISSESNKIDKYIYNENGLITSKERSNTFQGVSKLSNTTIYKYNDENLVIEKINGSGGSYYDYDENKNMVKIRGKSKNAYRYTLTYNTKKNPFVAAYPKAYCLIEPILLGIYNKTSVNEYSPDSNENIPTISQVYDYKYNKAGYPTESKVKYYNENGKLVITETTQFTYQ